RPVAPPRRGRGRPAVASCASAGCYRSGTTGSALNETARLNKSDGPPHEWRSGANATLSRTILPRHAAGDWRPQCPIRRLLTPSLAKAPSGPLLNLACKTVRVNYPDVLQA